MANEDFDITTARRVLTPWRNREKDPATKQRLTNLLNTAEQINMAPMASIRDQLTASFKKQWAEFEEHVRGAN